ncbi:MAG: sensor domain-containing protein [Bacteroidota bacterium]|nr:sensor domain-containing protein [Bacteroidota bacterium]
MKNIFSMDDPDYQKHKLFDPIVSIQTYLNLFYALIQLPLYLFLGLPLLILFLLGIVLIPFYLGASLLNLAFIYARSLVKINNAIFRIVLRCEIPRMKSPLPPPRSTPLQAFRYFARQKRDWKRLSYFLLQPFLGIISLALLGVIAILALLMVYTPVTGMFGHIQIFNLYQTDSFVEAIFAFFIGFVILAGLLHVVNYWIKLIGKFSISFTGR